MSFILDSNKKTKFMMTRSSYTLRKELDKIDKERFEALSRIDRFVEETKHSLRLLKMQSINSKRKTETIGEVKVNDRKISWPPLGSWRDLPSFYHESISHSKSSKSETSKRWVNSETQQSSSSLCHHAVFDRLGSSSRTTSKDVVLKCNNGMLRTSINEKIAADEETGSQPKFKTRLLIGQFDETLMNSDYNNSEGNYKLFKSSTTDLSGTLQQGNSGGESDEGTNVSTAMKNGGSRESESAARTEQNEEEQCFERTSSDFALEITRKSQTNGSEVAATSIFTRRKSSKSTLLRRASVPAMAFPARRTDLLLKQTVASTNTQINETKSLPEDTNLVSSQPLISGGLGTRHLEISRPALHGSVAVMTTTAPLLHTFLKVTKNDPRSLTGQNFPSQTSPRSNFSSEGCASAREKTLVPNEGTYQSLLKIGRRMVVPMTGAELEKKLWRRRHSVQYPLSSSSPTKPCTTVEPRACDSELFDDLENCRYLRRPCT